MIGDMKQIEMYRALIRRFFRFVQVLEKKYGPKVDLAKSFNSFTDEEKLAAAGFQGALEFGGKLLGLNAKQRKKLLEENTP